MIKQLVKKPSIPNSIVHSNLDNMLQAYYNESMKQWTPEKISKLRETYKMTRGALAELVGVLVITVYKWERGLIKPSKPTQLLLSRIEDDLKKGLITLTDKRKRKRKGG